MTDFSKESWLTLNNSTKRTAWNHASLVTIDNMPIDEAISNDVELFNDAINWLNRDAINELLRKAPEEVFWDSRLEYRAEGSFWASELIRRSGAPRRERRSEEEMVSMRDLSLYYNGTINYADGKLCKIIGHTEKGMICRPVKGGKSFVTKDLKPFNNVVTGFVNTPTGCVSCFRKPTRTAKEGINTESMVIGIGIAPWDNYPEEFMDMINNKYPSKEEAVEIAKRDGINVAISKFKYYDILSNKFVNVLNKRGKQERKRYELD